MTDAATPQQPRVTVDIDDHGVATVRMRDEAGRNAFSREFVDELVAALNSLGSADSAGPAGGAEVKVAVICGLPEVFSAGGDRSVLMGLAEGDVAPYDLLLTRSLLDVPVPTVAAMAGHAIGGGLVFGAACDILVMGASSRYACNFMDMGFTPGMGTTRLLQTALGEHIAAEMMYGCQYFKGKHFQGRSLVNYIEPNEKVEARAHKVAMRMTDKPRFALELLKRNLALPRRQAFEQARTAESLMHEICFSNPETLARIRDNYTPIPGDAAASGGQDNEPT